MAQEDLISLADRTTEEKQAIARMGGKASGVARRKKKTMQEQAQLLLSLAVKNPKLKKAMADLGIEENEQTNQMAMIISIMNKAISKGDVQAYNSIQATIGEDPVKKVEQTTDIKVSEKQMNAIDDITRQMKPMSEDDV